MKIKDILPEYFRHMRVIGRSEQTILTVQSDLGQFIRFLDSEQCTGMDQLNHDILAGYQLELSFRLTPKGTLLTIGSQTRMLMSVRVFVRYLKTEDYLLSDPAQKIRLPKTVKRLPKVILTRSEIRKLIRACGKNPKGHRNRLMIEILYDTAIRRAELTGIRIPDMDLGGGYVHVTGKGNRDRVVPMSHRVCTLVREYILHIRPALLGSNKDTGFLIPGRNGKQLSGDTVWHVIKQTCRQAGITKAATTHTFRHTCVTHMLRNGAPIRHLQQMLGHESLETTQIYTHVTINDLKEIHARYHPSGSAEDPPTPRLRRDK